MAKKMNFQLGGVNSNSADDIINNINSDNQYNFQFIPKEKIRKNDKNSQYSQDDIEELRDSILLNGLRHNLSVIHDLDTNTYRLVSGERRYNAICSMEEADYKKLFPTGIPCKIEKGNLDEIDEEIMLISANHDVRETSVQVKRWEVLRLKELYSMRGGIKATELSKKIAKHLDVSDRMARKYLSTEKLIPELSDMLDNGNIKLDDAEGLASLNEHSQQQIVDLIKNNNGVVDNEELKTIKKKYQEQEKEIKRISDSLTQAQVGMDKKDELIAELKKQINQLELQKEENNSEVSTDEKSKEELLNELESMKSIKKTVEAEKKQLQKQIEELKEQKKNTQIDKVEYEKIKEASEIKASLDVLEDKIKYLSNKKKSLSSLDYIKLRQLMQKLEELSN
jgi:ParB family chromosome partitioning protein